MKLRNALMLVVVAGCGGSSDSPATMPDGSNVDAPVTPPRKPATKFADTAESRSVPSSGLSDGFCSPSAASGTRHWATIDVDGDEFLDIVQTADTAFTSRVWDAAGTPYWKLFAGSAAGWTQTASNFSVPPNGRPGGFFSTLGVSLEWDTFDINGDQRADLIFTTDPTTAAVWDANGLPHWKVFLGTANGFAPTAIAWRVPTNGVAGGFTTTMKDSGGAQWVTVDITNDGRPDLIQTADPTTARVWDATSAPHWKVYENSGSSFQTQAKLWSVPANGLPTGFFATTEEYSTQQWVTLDLNNDGHLDLVQTADTATGTVWDANGAPYWKVFFGTATGFAASSTTWRVPPSGLSDGFYKADAETPYRRWSLVDIDGDGDQDLVQTNDTSFSARVWDAVGSPYWKVFANKGDGFSLELHRWNVPKGPTDGFYDTELASGALNWFLGDIDADGYLDLVHTMNPVTGVVWDATGAAYWKVFRGQP